MLVKSCSSRSGRCRGFQCILRVGAKTHVSLRCVEICFCELKRCVIIFTLFLKAFIHRLRAARVTADVLREPERQLLMLYAAGTLNSSIYINFHSIVRVGAAIVEVFESLASRSEKYMCLLCF